MNELDAALIFAQAVMAVLVIKMHLGFRRARRERDALLSRKALREAEEQMGSPRIVVINGIPMGEL